MKTVNFAIVIRIFIVLSVILLTADCGGGGGGGGDNVATGNDTNLPGISWMQKGIRVWYFGSVGTGGSSDAEEAFLFKTVNGNNIQVTKHSGLNHWGSTQPTETSAYSLDQGPCWIHPQVLKNIKVGDNWMGISIKSMYRNTYNSYNNFKNSNAEFVSIPYLLLPIKALFDLAPQREVVKLVYGNPLAPDFDEVWGTAFFDSETGLCLFNLKLTVSTTVFFILSEINYDFAGQKAFTEDNGPHTGFKSNAIKSSTPLNVVDIEGTVETRYGSTVQMWASTQAGGSITSFSPINENYCFFGGVPVLRSIAMTTPPTANYPPESWNDNGQYLWWWVPADALQKNTIKIFDVTMTRTSTAPYTFEGTGGAGLYFSKIIFDNNGYMTSFCAKDSAIGLDLCAGSTLYSNTKVDGLDYYKNNM
jgi:hypothetical protein